MVLLAPTALEKDQYIDATLGIWVYIACCGELLKFLLHCFFFIGIFSLRKMSVTDLDMYNNELYDTVKVFTFCMAMAKLQ